MIDLHIHSTASDGAMTPTEIVRAAKAAGLLAIALTDHDTVAGLDEAVAEGQAQGLTVVRGCELSTVSERGRMHILGLWLPAEPETLVQTMDELMAHRHSRNHLKIGRAHV